MAYKKGKHFMLFCALILFAVSQNEAMDCGIPDKVNNAVLEDDIGTKTAFAEGTVLKYDCVDTYRSSVSQMRICKDGQWETPFTCTRINCGYIEHPRNGRRIDGSYFVGDRLNFRCNEGYELSGRSMLCRADGEWRPKTPPTCDPVKCEENIDYIPNGDSFQEAPDGIRNIFKRVVSFTCDEGYDLIGSQKRTCQADGTWSGKQPVCTPPSCPDFEELANGIIYYEDDDINKITHIATIECNTNFDLFPNIPDGYNECIGKNQWEYPEFTCEERLEVRPGGNMRLYWIIGRNRRRIKSPTVLKSRTQLRSQCNSRYEMYDETTEEYLNTDKQNFKVMNGNLEPPMAICKEERCTVQRSKSTSFYTFDNVLLAQNQKIEHGVEIKKRCNENYEDLKKEKVICNKGTLRGATPCTPKRCIIPEGRTAYIRRNKFKQGSVVGHSLTVYLRCGNTLELFNSDENTYLDRERFESTCDFGGWTNSDFPVCKYKRCLVQEREGTSFYTIERVLVNQNQKVEHDTELQKRCANGFEDLKQEEVTCNKGTLEGDSPCTPKQSVIPNGRTAYLRGKELVEGSSVDHGQTVEVYCGNSQELIYLDTDTYHDGVIFNSTSEYGNWTIPTFPICTNKRCEIQGNEHKTYYTVNDELISPKQKVEHGTELKHRCNDGYEDLKQEKMTCDKGTLKGDSSCTPRKSTIPDGRTAYLRGRKLPAGSIVDHGETVSITCKRTIEELYYPDDNSYHDNERFESTSDYGNWTSPYFPICKHRRCRIENNPGTNLLRGNITMKPGEKVETGIHLERICDVGFIEQGDKKVECDRGRLTGFKPCSGEPCIIQAIKNSREYEQQTEVSHNKEIVLTCNEGFYLLRFGELVSSTGIEAKCILGNFTVNLDNLTCESRCKIERSDATSYRYTNDTQIESEMLVQNGVELIMKCRNNFTLHYRDSLRVLQEGTVTCLNGTLQPEYNCKSNRTDEESVRSDATEDSPKDGDDYFYYNAYGEDDANDDSEMENGIQLECAAPTNGILRKSFLNYYEVTCNDGYSLNTIENPRKFLCINGNLQSEILESQPMCKEDSCGYTTEMSRTIEIFEKVKNDKKYYSEGFVFEAGKRFYFNCKEKNMEPVKRAFKCSRGRWVSIQRDFDMIINNTHPECRKVNCDEGCKFGGTCVRDGECKCPPATRGKNCETPLCSNLCAQNGGECFEPNRCRCESPRYGANCEHVGCRLPKADHQVTFKDKTTTFQRDGILLNSDVTCPGGFVLSTSKDFVCRGNETWSGKVNCYEGTDYSIEFKVRDDRGNWPGTWCPMTVSMVNMEDELIGYFNFPRGKFAGRTYTDTKQMKYIGKIHRVDIVLQPYNGQYDDIKMDYIRVTVEDERRYEEYKMSDVESPGLSFSPKLDPGCTPPEFDGKYLRGEKKAYVNGDSILAKDIQCNQGLAPTVPSVTCQRGGEWTGIFSCSKDADYRAVLTFGSHHFAGEPGGKLQMVLKGSEGKLIAEWEIDGGLKKNTPVSAQWKAVYIPKASSLSLHVHGPSRLWTPDVQLTSIHLTVDSADNLQEYMFTDVGWVRPSLEINPDPGCSSPSTYTDSLDPDRVYSTNDRIRRTDVTCKDGYSTNTEEVTCLKSGKWSDDLCVVRPELITGITMTSMSSHVYNGITWGPELAVDGKQTRAPNTCNCCAATNYELEPWYRVDLGDQYDIYSVSVIGRGADGDNGHGHTLQNMRITYGLDTYNEKTLVDLVRPEYTWELSVTVPIKARYMELKLVGISQYFVICELKVFGVREGSKDFDQPPIPPPNDDRRFVSVSKETYEITINSEYVTRGPVYVIIQGSENNSKTHTFTETGLNKGETLVTVGPIDNIENLWKLIVFRPERWLNIIYTYIKIQSSGDEYLGFLGEPEEKRAEIDIHKLYTSNCEAESYTSGPTGYVTDREKVIDTPDVETSDDCKAACIENDSCKVAYVQTERHRITCKLISTNKLSAFHFTDTYRKGKIFFRIC